MHSYDVTIKSNMESVFDILYMEEISLFSCVEWVFALGLREFGKNRAAGYGLLK
jgi:hypothetical protein